MRILLVSQMYPGPDDPDLGTFVQTLERQLEERGHVLERAVVDRRSGGSARHLRLAWDTRRRAREFRPDVVYAHFLVPAGLWATLFGGAPVVLTAHGQDVENARSNALARRLTRVAVGRAAAVVCVSEWLRGRLAEAVPAAVEKTEVIDCGVDLERFCPRDRDEARARVGWSPVGTGFLCLGSLSERKNVLRLARAIDHANVEGELVLVGDGPLRTALAGRSRVRLVGRVPYEVVPDWLSAADVVCQPSLREPFGLATLEAMASGRSVVATRVGGPPEFVSPGAGVLVDPLDDEALAGALSQAAAMPRPNDAARAAATEHDVTVQAGRIEALLERAATSRPRGRGRRA